MGPVLSFTKCFQFL